MEKHARNWHDFYDLGNIFVFVPFLGGKEKGGGWYCAEGTLKSGKFNLPEIDEERRVFRDKNVDEAKECEFWLRKMQMETKKGEFWWRNMQMGTKK